MQRRESVWSRVSTTLAARAACGGRWPNGNHNGGGFKRSTQRSPLVYPRVCDTPVFFADEY